MSNFASALLMMLVDDTCLTVSMCNTCQKVVGGLYYGDACFPIFGGKMARSSYRTGPAALELDEGSSRPDGVGLMSLAA